VTLPMTARSHIIFNARIFRDQSHPASVFHIFPQARIMPRRVVSCFNGRFSFLRGCLPISSSLCIGWLLASQICVFPTSLYNPGFFAFCCAPEVPLFFASSPLIMKMSELPYYFLVHGVVQAHSIFVCSAFFFRTSFAIGLGVQVLKRTFRSFLDFSMVKPLLFALLSYPEKQSPSSSSHLVPHSLCTLFFFFFLICPVLSFPVYKGSSRNTQKYPLPFLLPTFGRASSLSPPPTVFRFPWCSCLCMELFQNSIPFPPTSISSCFGLLTFFLKSSPSMFIGVDSLGPSPSRCLFSLLLSSLRK